MNRREFLTSSAAAMALPAASAKAPNILFVMTDQHRFDVLGANGNRLVKTPNLDRLASQSANFQRAFVQAPVCVPSRVTFFTGRYPHSHRNRVNYTPLKSDEVLMQRYLKDAGYQTASVGKLHYYPPTAEHARSTGFDRVLLHDGVPYLNEYSDYSRWRRENDPLASVPFRQTVAQVAPGKNPFRMVIADEHTETSWVGLKTREYLQEMAEARHPFFLFSSFFQPHSPFVAPEPFDSMYDDVEIPLPKQVTLEEIQRLPAPLQKLILRGSPSYEMGRERLQWAYRTYYASVSQLDREIGQILDTLEQTGQAGNTIVVFSSDHGDQMLEHGLMGKNCFFESSMRVPFMIRYPGGVQPGKYDQLTETTDLLPTLFELSSIEEPLACQGRSLAPLLRGEDYAARDAVFAENIIPEVITTGRLDFAFEKGKGIKGIRHPDAKMVRTDRWKLNYYASGEGELYDLRNDPGEERNLFTDSAYATTVSELKGRLLDWLMTADEADQIAPRWRVGAPVRN
jgi:choline-sulfatase